MKKTLKRIAPLQFGKVVGAVYGLLSLIFVPFFLIFVLIGAFFPSQNSGLSSLVSIGFSLFMMLLIPIIYGIMGFIFGAIGAWGYNVIASWVGGIEVEVE